MDVLTLIVDIIPAGEAIVVLLGLVVALGVYKLVKEWLPW